MYTLGSVPRENMLVMRTTPRHPTIETGSPMAGCHLGTLTKPDFGRPTARFHVGQSIVTSCVIYISVDVTQMDRPRDRPTHSNKILQGTPLDVSHNYLFLFFV